jgi:hypothetical protein
MSPRNNENNSPSPKKSVGFKIETTEHENEPVGDLAQTARSRRSNQKKKSSKILDGLFKE